MTTEIYEDEKGHSFKIPVSQRSLSVILELQDNVECPNFTEEPRVPLQEAACFVHLFISENTLSVLCAYSDSIISFSSLMGLKTRKFQL